ncbi:MAG: hypothetical protein C3F15_14870 [Holophagae bacterium]|nr:MAG: hypothetical protein C3F15_14870 [Holophagae bacterium]
MHRVECGGASLGAPREVSMRLLIVAALLLFSSAPSFAQWQVRAGGNSLHNGAVDASGPESAQDRWFVPMAAWFGQPVFVEGDTVVTTWLTDAPMEERGVIVALHLTTGEVAWTRILPMDFPSDWSGYACAMRDGKVYATRAGNTNSSYLYALDAATGDTVWRSEDLVDFYVTEGPAFAANGDLLVPTPGSVTRIRATDGTRVYQSPRGGGMSGGFEPVVVGDTYYIRHGAVGDRLAAHDLATGDFLYWSTSIGTAQLGLFAGQDGTIYVPTDSSLYAFTDTGSSLTEKWVSPSLASCSFSTFAIGPDGSVYSYRVESGSVVVVRLDPETGLEIAASQPILNASSIVPGHMAVDRYGTLFVSNGQSELFAFNPDLSLLWERSVPRSEGGPSLAADGTLLVSGDTGVFAFLGTVFWDGFESGDTSAWSATVP